MVGREGELAGECTSKEEEEHGSDAGAKDSDPRAPASKPKLWMLRSGAFDCDPEEKLSVDGLRLEEKRYLSNGNRGVIYSGQLVSVDGKRTRVAIKELLHEKLRKPGRVYMSDCLENEAYWLKRVNDHGIGPQLHFADSSRVVMEFIEGKRILAFLDEERSVDSCVSTLVQVMQQLRELDSLGIHKGEFVKPDRHILIREGGQPILLDFERCKETSSPQNVTQFCQFLTSKRLLSALESCGDCDASRLDLGSLRAVCQEYKSRGFQALEYERMIEILRAISGSGQLAGVAVPMPGLRLGSR